MSLLARFMIKGTQTRRWQFISGARSRKRQMTGKGRGDGICQVRIFFDSGGKKSCALDRTNFFFNEPRYARGGGSGAVILENRKIWKIAKVLKSLWDQEKRRREGPTYSCRFFSRGLGASLKPPFLGSKFGRPRPQNRGPSPDPPKTGHPLS